MEVELKNEVKKKRCDNRVCCSCIILNTSCAAWLCTGSRKGNRYIQSTIKLGDKIATMTLQPKHVTWIVRISALSRVAAGDRGTLCRSPFRPFTFIRRPLNRREQTSIFQMATMTKSNLCAEIDFLNGPWESFDRLRHSNRRHTINDGKLCNICWLDNIYIIGSELYLLWCYRKFLASVNKKILFGFLGENVYTGLIL